MEIFYCPKSHPTSGPPPPPPAPQHKVNGYAYSISRERVLTLIGCALVVFDTGRDFFYFVLKDQVIIVILKSRPELEILGLGTVSIEGKASHMKSLLRGESRGIQCQIVADK